MQTSIVASTLPENLQQNGTRASRWPYVVGAAAGTALMITMVTTLVMMELAPRAADLVLMDGWALSMALFAAACIPLWRRGEVRVVAVIGSLAVAGTLLYGITGDGSMWLVGVAVAVAAVGIGTLRDAPLVRFASVFVILILGSAALLRLSDVATSYATVVQLMHALVAALALQGVGILIAMVGFERRHLGARDVAAI